MYFYIALLHQHKRDHIKDSISRYDPQMLRLLQIIQNITFPSFPAAACLLLFIAKLCCHWISVFSVAYDISILSNNQCTKCRKWTVLQKFHSCFIKNFKKEASLCYASSSFPLIISADLLKFS